jgi:hypothetical protein
MISSFVFPLMFAQLEVVALNVAASLADLVGYSAWPAFLPIERYSEISVFV